VIAALGPDLKPVCSAVAVTLRVAVANEGTQR
jgi:hypothetical protein